MGTSVLSKYYIMGTTFNISFGKYRYTAVPFEFYWLQEVYHRTVREHFAFIDGFESDIDDISVGNNYLFRVLLLFSSVWKP